MNADSNLFAALWRAWYFKGAPESELEAASLFLARLLTAAALVALPLVGYYSVYLTFNPLALCFPALIMVGVLLSKETVSIAPRVRMGIIAGVIFVDATISLAQHETLLAGTAALLCVSHVLVLSHGFRVATTVGAMMIGGFLFALNGINADSFDLNSDLHTLTVLLWLMVFNFILATVYGSATSLHGALLNTNERLVIKLQTLQQLVATAAENISETSPEAPSVSLGNSAPKQGALPKEALVDGFEMFVWGDLFSRVQRSVNSVETGGHSTVHYVPNQ